MVSSGSIEGIRPTIVAPITAPGAAAVAIVRMSGAESRRILSAITKSAENIIKEPRKIFVTPLTDLIGVEEAANDFLILDNAIVVFFASPESYTGEDSVEFHLHGSRFIVDRLLKNLLHLGAKLARPGEFTERAYLNGKLDLSQAEAVCDLINAETASQVRIAQEQLSGKLTDAMSALGEPLRELVAEIEAHIDFPEDGIDEASLENWGVKVASVVSNVEQYLESFNTGRLLREGARVTLVGLPNAGKSSLLNRLLGEDRAIVTPIPGTTRDSIEELVSLSGLPVRISDTAGLVEENGHSLPNGRSVDEIEKLGILRSWKQAKDADLILYVIDSAASFSLQENLFKKAREFGRPILVVVNKTDLLLLEDISLVLKNLDEKTKCRTVGVSALTGKGISDLKRTIYDELLTPSNITLSYQRRGGVCISNLRHFESLKKARSALRSVLVAIEEKVTAPEIIALELRTALLALEEIVGVTHSEDILGRIFSRFCIGK